jgi:hypothetical protein
LGAALVDDTGKVVREVKVTSEPEALLAVLKNPAYHFKRIGLEAGPLSQWLFSAVAEAELPVVCVETRHMQAVLKARESRLKRIFGVVPDGPHRTDCLNRALFARASRDQRGTDGAFHRAGKAGRHQ